MISTPTRKTCKQYCEFPSGVHGEMIVEFIRFGIFEPTIKKDMYSIKVKRCFQAVLFHN